MNEEKGRRKPAFFLWAVFFIVNGLVSLPRSRIAIGHLRPCLFR
ncbi:hypothetical protein [Dyella sp. C9]|nr:hypothetical protein [Dyella sp. C9]